MQKTRTLLPSTTCQQRDSKFAFTQKQNQNITVADKELLKHESSIAQSSEECVSSLTSSLTNMTLAQN